MSDMSPKRLPCGAASVGRLTDLDPVEAGAVLYLRLCWDNPDALAALTDDFTPLLGPSAGSVAARSFVQLAVMCQSHGRRALCAHALTCACLGGDEACFARLVADAANGAREDALMMAMLLVRADFAPIVTGLAQEAGLALQRMALRADRIPHALGQDRPSGATLH